MYLAHLVLNTYFMQPLLAHFCYLFYNLSMTRPTLLFLILFLPQESL